MQPPGVAAAGSAGLAADGKHVHPYQPWQFLPETYGAKGNGIVVSDATMGAASHNLACTTSTPFSAGDVGKQVTVMNAGASGYPLVTTIATVVDSGHVTLTGASTGAVTAVGCIFGTDDTAAIQTAINNAVTYATANDGYCEVIFRPVFYIVAGAEVTGGTPNGNAQITLPIIAAGSARKVVLALLGLQATSSPHVHFAQTVPALSGATLISFGQGTNDATYGPACVIGGPYAGYGGGNGTFSNMLVVVEGLTISPLFYNIGFGNPGVTSRGPGFGGLNLWGVAQAQVKSFTFHPVAVMLTSATSWYYFKSPEGWDQQWQPGLVMPVVGNIDMADIGIYTCFGAWVGLVGSEHCNAQALRIQFTGRGVQCQGGGGGGPAAHGLQILYMSSESTQVPVAAETSGWYHTTDKIGIKIETLDLESFDANEIIYDPGGFLSGQIYFNDLTAPGYRSGGEITASSGSPIRLIQLNMPPGPVSSPQAAPSSTNAWPNYYYRDAEITVSVSGGTLSALTITGVSLTAISQTIPASTTFYRFMLPSGASYTPTYTGTLTHTVTLL